MELNVLGFWRYPPDSQVSKSLSIFEGDYPVSRCIIAGQLYCHFVADFWIVQSSEVEPLDAIIMGTVTAVSPGESTQVIDACISNRCLFSLPHNHLLIITPPKKKHERNQIENEQS